MRTEYKFFKTGGIALIYVQIPCWQAWIKWILPTNIEVICTINSHIHRKGVQTRLEKLIKARRQLLEQLAGCDAELLTKKPAPEKWNALQILHHVYLAERGTLNYIVKKLQFSKEGLPKAGIVSHLKTLLLQIVLKSPLKMKAPAGLDAASGDVTLEELGRQWEALNDEFQSLLSKLNEKQLASQLFRHPFIGRIDMTDTLKFMQAHFDHHRSQVNKLIS